MSTTHELEHNGKKITITVANTGQGKYVGTYSVANTDPLIRGEGADALSEEEALHNAQDRVKELLDAR
ncbi:MAG TPA: hypothetical protein VED01_17770 [Burkholderiales bacterium]|nr:hypothetical protein [Burkholderiales bacterium]